MDKYLYDIPAWAEFVFDSGYNIIYWGGKAGYRKTSDGIGPEQGGWNESNYQHWKGHPLTKLVVHQLEND